MRIAIGQISCESNHFVNRKGETDLFRLTGYLLEGDRMLTLADANNEIGGALAVLNAETATEVIPLVAARASLAGPLSSACYAELKGIFLWRLRAALPLDGILLSFHGSTCAVDVDDTEGDVCAAARSVAGPGVPIAVSLDLHANVTRRMVECTGLIVGYRHYPHDDTFQTGERAARLLLSTIRGDISPVAALVKLPMLLTAFNASTATPGPFADMMERCLRLESPGRLLCGSVFFVGSYIDVPEVGCSVLAVSDGDAARAVSEAKSLAVDYWGARRHFTVTTVPVEEAVRKGREVSGGPVLLLDTADTVGGGAAGDSSALIRGLLSLDIAEPCAAMVVDAPAAAECIRAGVGNTVTVRLGYSVDPSWGTAVEVTGVVRRVSDGRFRYSGGIFGGTTSSMGPSAVLQAGPLQILVMSEATYDWGREQYESVGIDVRRMKFVGVKNMMNFRIGYQGIMKGVFVLDLPGPTPPDPRPLPFRRIQRPLYPFDPVENTPVFTVSQSPVTSGSRVIGGDQE